MFELSYGIKSNHYEKTVTQNFQDVFGQGSMLSWLSPFHRPHTVKLPVQKKVLLELITPVNLS